MYSLLGKDWRELTVSDRRAIRAGVEDVLARKWFVVPSFGIYGGSAGLYDLGPPGCQVKTNVIGKWRDHFIIEENMLEIDSPCVTPQIVLRASGHERKFADLLVREVDTPTEDVVTGSKGKAGGKGKKEKEKDKKTSSAVQDCWRLDHLFEEWAEGQLESIDLPDERRKAIVNAVDSIASYGIDEWREIIDQFDVRSPNGKKLSDPITFNLMFGTQIGPLSANKAFLRPETAQGIFVNFHRVFSNFGLRPPFAMAQIGNAYRNEISPKAGLLRVREFTMAEIEHFLPLDSTDHPKFSSVADVHVPLLSKENQLSKGGHAPATMTTLGDAVRDGTIHDETLAYFMGRTFLFLTSIGLLADRLRFRQHLETEMAHYASDCWDLEAYTTFGWVELVGHANRGSYDLQAHSELNPTKEELASVLTVDPPVFEDQWQIVPNKKLLGMKLRKNAGPVLAKLDALVCGNKDDELTSLAKDLDENGEISVELDGTKFWLEKKEISIVKTKKKVTTRRFFPRVVEPSFGIGRIMYTLFEHSFSVRLEDEQRVVMRFPSVIAPWKVAILPLSGTAVLQESIPVVRRALMNHTLSHWVDASGVSIGRRYSRMDEFGIPFAMTIDFGTVTSDDPLYGTITLRERDSCEQIRGKLEDICDLVVDLGSGRTTWKEMLDCGRFPVVHDAES